MSWSRGQERSGDGIVDPVYLAIVDDDTLRATISKGRTGTAMSAFAQKEGGMLTDAAGRRHHSRHPPALEQAQRLERRRGSAVRGEGAR